MAITHSSSKRNLKSSYVRDLGAPMSQQALMVKIDWTTAPIVSVTIKKSFQMPTSTMSISKKTGYQVISTQTIAVQAGMQFKFVRSSEPGWYYIVRWSESYHKFCCSCPSGRIRHCCKHIDMVTVKEEVASELPVVASTRVETPTVSQGCAVEEITDEEVAKILSEIDAEDRARVTAVAA